MVKSIVLTLLATSLLAAEANEIPKPTRNFQFNSNNPHTVAIGLDLFTVSYYSGVVSRQHKVYLNVTSTNRNYKPCKIPLNPELNMIRGRTKAASVKHKIVLWGDGSKGFFVNYTLRNYKVFLIDPSSCTHRVLPDIVDKAPNSYTFIEPEIVIHHDTFDIFYPSQTQCSPCSFDLNGNKIKLTQQIKPQVIKSQFYVRSVGKSERYVAAYNLLNESVAVTLFDESLNSERSKFLESNTKLIRAAINSIENESRVGIISAFPKNLPNRPIYTVFDNNLNAVFSTHPPLLEDYDFDDAFANVDSLGNSYVTLIQKEKRGPNKKITLIRYDANGRLTGKVLLGTRIHMGSVVGRKEQAVLIAEQEYCLITHERSGYLNPTETTKIKCIDVRA